MRTLHATTAAVTALAISIPTFGAAQELGVNAGVAITSEYVSQGIKFSDGPAVQPYVELSYGGLYGGVWATNGDEDLLFAKSEIDYYIGYRSDIDAFYYDVAVAYYTFQDEVGAVDYEEYLLSAGYGLSLQLYLTAFYGYAPEFEQSDLSVDLDYYTNFPGLIVSGSLGTVSSSISGADEWSYWSVGANYSLNDSFTFDLAYHDSDETGEFIEGADGLVVATISYDY